MEPITIYECRNCGLWRHVPSLCLCDERPKKRVPVRLFREEDVRPLWEAAKQESSPARSASFVGAVDAFPAPEEWKQ